MTTIDRSSSTTNQRIAGDHENDHLIGGAGNDRINGRNGDDVLYGGGGNDRIDGGAGNDLAEGGQGDDTLLGREGADVLHGGKGSDKIDGGKGDDQLFGDEGDDRLDGGDGRDYLEGGTGDDVLLGRDGEDELHGGEGNDKIDGGKCDDQIFGEGGDDRLDGGDGNDSISGGDGDDSILGRAGDDLLNGGAGDDEVKAGSGNDTGRFYASENWHNSNVYDGGTGADTLELYLTESERIAAADDFTALDAYFAGGAIGTFQFQAFDLKVKNWESYNLNLHNTAPTAQDDTNTTSEDVVVSGNVLSNDNDSDHLDELTVLSFDDISSVGAAVSVASDGTYTYDPGTLFQHLEDGGTAIDTFSYAVQDLAGATATATTTITITGGADNVLISSADTSGVINELSDNEPGENSDTLASNGTLQFSNVNSGSSHSVEVSAKGSDYRGTLSTYLTDAGNGSGVVSWAFSISDAQLDDLAEGQTLVQSYEITIDDGAGSSVTETLNLSLTGSNDAPVVITSENTGTAAELADDTEGENLTTHTDTGTIVFTDADLNDGHTIMVSENGSDYRGRLNASLSDPVAGDGTGEVSWTYSVSDAELADLASGDLLTQSYDITLADGNGGEVSQTVTVTITGNDDAPELNLSLVDQSVNLGSTLHFTLPEDLFIDPEGGNLIYSVEQVDGAALPDWLSFDSDSRAFTGTPTEYTELGSLQLRVSGEDPSGLTSSAVFSFNVGSSELIEGAVGDDRLKGTNESDWIRGNDGNDSLDGRGGNDTLDGGNGNDRIEAGAGDDVVEGGNGDDTILGRDGADELRGGQGNDKVDGGRHDDRLFGGDGNDRLDGGTGDDFVEGGAGSDTILGRDGADELHGGEGSDKIDGGRRDDQLFGGGGDDRLDAGDGDDLVEGGLGDDTILGRDGVDELHGGEGNDKIDGGRREDEIFGDGGDDHLDGGAGDDTINGGEGNDTLLGRSGNDRLNGGAGNDEVIASSGDDIGEFYATENWDNSNFYNGGSGNDTLKLYLTESERITAADDLAALDSYLAEGAKGTFQFQAFDLKIKNWETVKVNVIEDSDPTDSAESTDIVGTPSSDEIDVAASQSDLIINALAGNDSITTGEGNDTVRPGEGADIVNTGEGNDIVVLVGQTADGQYVQSDINNPGGLGVDLSSVITLADLNDRATSEVVVGESIDGGAGIDRLVIYGDVDFTGATLVNISQFQVNSTITISAQQLSSLDLSIIIGDGESVLNITNDEGVPTTLDLSNTSLINFHTLNLDSGVSVIVDQTDVDSVLYITGDGALKASDATATLDLTGKFTNLEIQDKDGNPDASHGGASYIAGELLIGSETADILIGDDTDDRLEGGAGDDTLIGGKGNDILRGGAGVDSMDGGEGNDTFVIVGDISGGGKVDSPEDTTALGFPLTDLNFKDLNEDEDGGAEVVIGGEGHDTLYVFGGADLSNSDISGIEQIEIRSDVLINDDVLKVVSNVSGDGSSTLRIVSKTGAPVELDLARLTLAKIGHIELDKDVTLKVDSLDQLGGARILTGEGTIEAKSGTLPSLDGYTLTTSISVKHADGTLVDGGERLEHVVTRKVGNAVSGTDGDDYLIGTAGGETFVSGDGNDLLSGKGGDDTYFLSGTGTKTIIDGSGIDTLDLTLSAGQANVDLTDGGSIHGGEVILGSGESVTGKIPIDLFILEDLSGSFSDDVVTVRGLLDDLITQIKSLQPDSQFGVGGFVDKPISPFGSSYSGDYVYKTVSKLSSDTTAVKSAFDSMTVRSGGDWHESQLEALYQVALRTAEDDTSSSTAGDEVGFREGSMRVVVLATDAPYHVAGDFAGAGANNGDTILDGVPEGTGEDYPTVAKVKEALLNANIYPVFAVTSGNEGVYSDLVSQLGRGDVVNLTSNSSNLVSSITSGLESVKLDFIENITGTQYDDTLIGNSLDNKISGGQGDDILIGGAGGDHFSGGEGADLVKYDGLYSDYRVSQKGTSIVVTKKSDPSESDIIDSDIESIQFSDALKSSVFSGGRLLEHGESGAALRKVNFLKEGVSYFGESLEGEYSFDKEFSFGLGGLGDEISIGEYKWNKSLIDFDLEKDFSDVYDVVESASEKLPGGYSFNPDSYLKADAWVDFSAMTLDFDNSFIKFPISGGVELGSFDLDYSVFTELDSYRDGTSLVVESEVKGSAQSSEFGNLIGDFSLKLGLEPDLDIEGGGLSAGVSYAADFIGIDPVDAKISYEADLSSINKEYTLLDFDLDKLKDVAEEHWGDFAFSASGKTGHYGRFDAKGNPYKIDFNLPNFSALGDSEVVLSYPDSSTDGGLLDINATFNSWDVGKDMVQAWFDIDDLIGLAYKPMKFTDLHVNYANITSKDYRESSEIGKAVFDGLAKADAFGKAFSKEYHVDDKGWLNIDNAIAGIQDGIDAARGASAKGGVNLGQFHIPFDDETTDMSIEFDATLFGLDVNVGLSPVIKFDLDVKDVLFDMEITSDDAPGFIESVGGVVGEAIRVELPDAISDINIDVEYALDIQLESTLCIGYNVGLDMRAFGINGTALGYEIPDLPEGLIEFGDIKSDDDYLIHLPPNGSDDEHLKYDLFSGEYEVKEFSSVSLGLPGVKESYDFDLI